MPDHLSWLSGWGPVRPWVPVRELDPGQVEGGQTWRPQSSDPKMMVVGRAMLGGSERVGVARLAASGAGTTAGAGPCASLSVFQPVEPRVVDDFRGLLTHDACDQVVPSRSD